MPPKLLLTWIIVSPLRIVQPLIVSRQQSPWSTGTNPFSSKSATTSTPSVNTFASRVFQVEHGYDQKVAWIILAREKYVFITYMLYIIYTLQWPEKAIDFVSRMQWRFLYDCQIFVRRHYAALEVGERYVLYWSDNQYLYFSNSKWNLKGIIK